MTSETKQQTRDGQASGCLFIVATPIGNLGDITYRAVETLRTVDAIAAEDTRNSRKLLAHYGITTPMFALHEHNEQAMIDRLLPRLKGGEKIALISDAGTPLISDPGYRLVQALSEQAIPVIPIPGPSSILAALCASGLATDRFRYLGFAARSGKARRRTLTEIAESPDTCILLESPKRLLATLKELAGLVEEDRRICVARELTKLHEEFVRGNPAAIIRHFEEHAPRGEIVLLVAGRSMTSVEITDDRILELLQSEEMRKLSPSARARRIARELGVSRSRVYALDIKRNP